MTSTPTESSVAVINTYDNSSLTNTNVNINITTNNSSVNRESGTSESTTNELATSKSVSTGELAPSKSVSTGPHVIEHNKKGAVIIPNRLYPNINKKDLNIKNEELAEWISYLPHVLHKWKDRHPLFCDEVIADFVAWCRNVYDKVYKTGKDAFHDQILESFSDCLYKGRKPDSIVQIHEIVRQWDRSYKDMRPLFAFEECKRRVWDVFDDDFYNDTLLNTIRTKGSKENPPWDLPEVAVIKNPFGSGKKHELQRIAMKGVADRLNKFNMKFKEITKMG